MYVNVNVHILSPTTNDLICVMKGSNSEAYVQANVLFDGHAHYYAIVPLDPDILLLPNDSNNVIADSCKSIKSVIKEKSKRAHLLASEEGLVILSEIREKDRLRKQKSRKKLKLLELNCSKDISPIPDNNNSKGNEKVEEDTSEHEKAKLIINREKNRLKKQKYRNKLKILKYNMKNNEITSCADNKLELLLEVNLRNDNITKSDDVVLQGNENIDISPNKKQKTRETVAKHRRIMNSTENGKKFLGNRQKKFWQILL